MFCLLIWRIWKQAFEHFTSTERVHRITRQTVCLLIGGVQIHLALSIHNQLWSGTLSSLSHLDLFWPFPFLDFPILASLHVFILYRAKSDSTANFETKTHTLILYNKKTYLAVNHIPRHNLCILKNYYTGNPLIQDVIGKGICWFDSN